METEKLELIHWITELKDTSLIKKILEIKDAGQPTDQKSKVRSFGSGKKIIGNIAEDFNASLEDFKAYYK